MPTVKGYAAGGFTGYALKTAYRERKRKIRRIIYTLIDSGSYDIYAAIKIFLYIERTLPRAINR